MASIKVAYLTAYNVALFAAWCGAVALLVIGTVESGGELSLGASRAFPLIKVLVAVAWVEVMHTFTGLTKGSGAAAFIQVLGRFSTTFWIIRKNPEVLSLEVSFFLFLTWAIIELVRYPYYALLLHNRSPTWLSNLRYSIFIPLYPIGMILEWFCYRIALPYIKIRDYYSVHLPNKNNFAFSFYTFCCCVLVAYFIIGPIQYKYMVDQRRKRLSAEKVEPHVKQN